SSIRPGDGLPGYQVASMFEDHAGRIWVGVDDGLYLYSHGHFQRIGGTTNQHLGLVVGITEDRENNIWVEASGAKRRLVRIQNFEVKEELSAAEVPEAHALAADPKGGIWLGLLDGDLALYRHGVVHRVRLNHPKDGITGEIVVNPDGSVLSATPYALVGWRNGTTQFLTSQNGLPCDGVYGFIRDKKNNLWLYTPCGLSEIDSAEFDRWWSHPDTKVQLRFFDTFDGVRPGRTYFWPVAKTPDGRLWFATGSSLQMIDPASLSKNAPPVPVNIESIVANRISYKPQEALRLPSLIRNLEVNYTALSFVAPRKLRFRYKLDGDDVSWQDPGTRRQAFYTDLRPGNYSFHVIATNSDGAWNDVGATLNFSIAPTWYQTVWFYVLCSLVILSLVLIVYSFRVQQLSTRMAAGFDERLAERTRLARELHDTLLQTIQGSKIIADDALDSATPSNPMRKPMEVLSGLLAVAVKEGRAALNSLRTFSAQGDDLADALKRATAPLIDTVPIQMHFSVRGETRDIHPIVRDEVYHIGYEAIRNASLHSSGSQLEVTIDYNDDLLLRVIDNGKGIDPIVLKEGRPGHFGLQGMTERADRIGGSISFFSSEASGTEVRLTVPGRSAFRKPHVLP
ncbi:MAG TPA: two-component regulator propeller domain-containing protein, partial [Edaphobacter sp.]|nr:two-component regulator propeller domain-containing protein [Edaphobacter sp.]